MFGDLFDGVGPKYPKKEEDDLDDIIKGVTDVDWDGDGQVGD